MKNVAVPVESPEPPSVVATESLSKISTSSDKEGESRSFEESIVKPPPGGDREMVRVRVSFKYIGIFC